MKGAQWDRPLRTEASKTWRRADLLRMLRLMGCPDPEAGLEGILGGFRAEMASGERWLSAGELRRELSYEMRTGEGRRIDDPEFGRDDARRMLRRIRNRERVSGEGSK
jgi:hypothetical protein